MYFDTRLCIAPQYLFLSFHQNKYCKIREFNPPSKITRICGDFFFWCLFILRNVVHFKMLPEYPILVCYFMSKHVKRKTLIVYVLKQNIWHFVTCQFHSNWIYSYCSALVGLFQENNLKWNSRSLKIKDWSKKTTVSKCNLEIALEKFLFSDTRILLLKENWGKKKC